MIERRLTNGVDWTSFERHFGPLNLKCAQELRIAPPTRVSEGYQVGILRRKNSGYAFRFRARFESPEVNALSDVFRAVHLGRDFLIGSVQVPPS